MKAKNFIFVGILFVLAAVLAYLSLPLAVGSDEVKVGILCDEGLYVVGENPVTVKKGDGCKFVVKAEEGYFVRSSDVGTVVNGMLVLSNVKKSQTIRITAGKTCTVSVTSSGNGEVVGMAESYKTGESFTATLRPNANYEVGSITVGGKEYPIPANNLLKFKVEDDTAVEVTFVGKPLTFMTVTGNLGYTTVANKTEVYRYGDTLMLDCDYERDHVVFSGWSENGYLSDGGTLLSTEERFDYVIKENTVLYANFKDKTEYTLTVDANGGSGRVTESHAYGEYVNLPVDNGSITREGYALVGYSENADGSGEIYSLGAMTVMPRGDKTYYAVWMKETSLSELAYQAGDTTVMIVGFADGKSAETLVIPKKIDGKPVTAIASDAFAGTDIKTAVIPNGVTAIYGGAFAYCPKLTTVYLPETLTVLSDEAFTGSASFKNLRILASYARVFDYDYDSALADKFMRLHTSEGKRLIVVGGSSLSFGLNSAMIKEAFPEYTVINFSVSAMYGIRPIFEMLEAETREGDIVVYAPEYYYIMYGYGEAEYITNWQYLESNYDILCDFDISTLPTLLSTYTSYLAEKRAYLPYKKTNADNVYVRSAFNELGDLTAYRSNKYYYEANLPSAGVITEEGMAYYNKVSAALKAKGVASYFTFPPSPIGSWTRDQVKSATAGFTARLNALLDSSVIKVISAVEDYSFDSSYFYDSVYHLTLEGANVRTKQLITDLKSVVGK